jgi:hypothetical protein
MKKDHGYIKARLKTHDDWCRCILMLNVGANRLIPNTGAVLRTKGFCRILAGQYGYVKRDEV